MFFIWGHRRTRSILGYVAEWCGYCQSAVPGVLTEQRRKSHAYFIPLGSGTVLGHEFVCGVCRATVATSAAHYASVAHSPQSPFPQLLQYTNPRLHAALHAGPQRAPPQLQAAPAQQAAPQQAAWPPGWNRQ